MYEIQEIVWEGKLKIVLKNINIGRKSNRNISNQISFRKPIHTNT